MEPTHHPSHATTRSALAVCAALLLFSTLNPQLSIFAQGSLTPPGAPAPTMKTLAQIEPRTPISSLPYSITNAGSYYITANLTGVTGQNGVIISNGNVTLDLNGFALIGVSSSLDGIFVSGSLTNIAIYHGTIYNWGNFGVEGGSANYSQFSELKCNFNAYSGITAGYGCAVENCVSIGNGSAGLMSGITILANSTIRNCTASGNTGTGLYVFNGKGTIISCISSLNLGSGIDVGGGYCVVSGCTIQDNAADGIFTGGNCRLVDNLLSGNNTTSSGAAINVYGTGNRIEGNLLSGNHSAGLKDTSSPGGNFILKNTVKSGILATNFVIAASSIVGPLIATTGTITNSNPWANFSF